VHSHALVVPREVTGFHVWFRTGVHPYASYMARYQVTMKDRTVEVIADADAYQQEGPMTTFFSTGPGRQIVDCWSSRIASFRTSEIMIVRRVDEAGVNATVAGAADDELVVGRGVVCSTRSAVRR